MIQRPDAYLQDRGIIGGVRLDIQHQRGILACGVHIHLRIGAGQQVIVDAACHILGVFVIIPVFHEGIGACAEGQGSGAVVSGSEGHNDLCQIAFRDQLTDIDKFRVFFRIQILIRTASIPQRIVDPHAIDVQVAFLHILAPCTVGILRPFIGGIANNGHRILTMGQALYPNHRDLIDRLGISIIGAVGSVVKFGDNRDIADLIAGAVLDGDGDGA